VSKSKGKGGTGRGTDKKGWNRWQASANRARSKPKPYKSKGVKKDDGAAVTESRKSDKPGN
jgi:hypothetical protein